MATKYPHVARFMQTFVDYDNAVGEAVQLNGRTPEEVWVDEPAMAVADAYLAVCAEETVQALVVGGTWPVDMPEEVHDCLNSIMQTLWDEVEAAEEEGSCGAGGPAAPDDFKHRANMRVYAACYGVIL